MITWKDFSNIRIFRQLRLKKDATLTVLNSDGTGSDISTSELKRVRGATPFVVSGNWVAASTDSHFFIANRAYTVKSITANVEVAGTDAGAVTAAVKKAASGTDIAAGTALHTGTINLKGTVDTNQDLTLEAAANLAIAAGDRIGLDFTGVLTAAVGAVSVALEPA